MRTRYGFVNVNFFVVGVDFLRRYYDMLLGHERIHFAPCIVQYLVGRDIGEAGNRALETFDWPFQGPFLAIKGA